MRAEFRPRLVGLAIAACVATCSLFATAEAPTQNAVYADPARTDEDFPFQGEYAGTLTTGVTPEKYGMPVIALGDGAFDVIGYPGGLPGGPQKTEQPTGPLHLQDHANPVRYRNIWVKPKS